MRFLVMFVPAVCVLFLIKLRWPKKKNFYHIDPNLFHQFYDNCKIPSYTYYLKEAETKIAMFTHSKKYHGNTKYFNSLYDFAGRRLKIRDVCMNILNHISKFMACMVSFHSKSIILGQMTNLNMIFRACSDVSSSIG